MAALWNFLILPGSYVKKILIIQGSGRPNRSTDQLVRAFAKGVNDAVHKIEILLLFKNEVKEGLGCNACRYGKSCVQKNFFNDMV